MLGQPPFAHRDLTSVRQPAEASKCKCPTMLLTFFGSAVHLPSPCLLLGMLQAALPNPSGPPTCRLPWGRVCPSALNNFAEFSQRNCGKHFVGLGNVLLASACVLFCTQRLLRELKMLSALQQAFLPPHLSDTVGVSSRVPACGSGGFDLLRAWLAAGAVTAPCAACAKGSRSALVTAWKSRPRRLAGENAALVFKGSSSWHSCKCCYSWASQFGWIQWIMVVSWAIKLMPTVMHLIGDSHLLHLNSSGT